MKRSWLRNREQKEGLDGIDSPNLYLDGEPLEMKNVSTQAAQTDGMNNHKALKQAMTADYHDQDRVRHQTSY